LLPGNDEACSGGSIRPRVAVRACATSRPACPSGYFFRHLDQDLGADYYDRQRDVRRQISHHVGKLGALGFEVTLCRIPDPESGETRQTTTA